MTEPSPPHRSRAPASAGSGTQLSVAAGENSASFRLRGELDLLTGPVLTSLVAAQASAPRADGVVILDLEELTFIDVAGLRAVVTAHRLLRRANGQLVLARPSAQMVRILELTGLSRELSVVPDGVRVHRGPSPRLVRSTRTGGRRNPRCR